MSRIVNRNVAVATAIAGAGATAFAAGGNPAGEALSSVALGFLSFTGGFIFGDVASGEIAAATGFDLQTAFGDFTCDLFPKS